MVDARLRIAVNGRAYRGDAPIGDGIVSLQPLSPGQQLHPLFVGPGSIFAKPVTFRIGNQ
jgi:hypothetical protein